MPKPSEMIIEKFNNIKKESNLVTELIARLESSSQKNLNSLGNELRISYQKNPFDISKKIYFLIKSIQLETQYTNVYKISKRKYKKLILKRQEGNISQEDNKILEEALFSKVCNCVQKKLSQSTADWLIGKWSGNVDNPPYNPYAICTSSIYNDRNFSRNKSFSECPEKITTT